MPEPPPSDTESAADQPATTWCTLLESRLYNALLPLVGLAVDDRLLAQAQHIALQTIGEVQRDALAHGIQLPDVTVTVARSEGDRIFFQIEKSPRKE